MNFENLRLLYGKEILDLFRDRRTLFTMLVMPVLMMPISMVGTNVVMSQSRKEAKQQRFRIAVTAPPEAAEMVKALRSAGLNVEDSPDAKAETESKKAAAGIVITRAGSVLDTA